MERILSTRAAAEVLGVRPGTLRAWRCAGFGPAFVRLGRGLRSPVGYREEEIERFLKSQMRRSTGDDRAVGATISEVRP